MRYIFFSAFLVLLASCQSTVTEKSLRYADNLKDAIDKFESSRQKVAKHVSTASEKATTELSKENPDVGRAARDWEQEWNDINKRFKDLEERFSQVGNTSEKYFEQLDELSKGIESEGLRQSELSKNQALREQYAVAYEDAARNIDKIREVLREGNDYHRVLVASSMRQKISQNIDELRQISERAQQIVAELEQFTIEGKKLIAA